MIAKIRHHSIHDIMYEAATHFCNTNIETCIGNDTVPYSVANNTSFCIKHMAHLGLLTLSTSLSDKGQVISWVNNVYVPHHRIKILDFCPLIYRWS